MITPFVLFRKTLIPVFQDDYDGFLRTLEDRLVIGWLHLSQKSHYLLVDIIFL